LKLGYLHNIQIIVQLLQVDSLRVGKIPYICTFNITLAVLKQKLVNNRSNNEIKEQIGSENILDQAEDTKLAPRAKNQQSGKTRKFALHGHRAWTEINKN
jgi:hypothetical protein